MLLATVSGWVADATWRRPCAADDAPVAEARPAEVRLVTGRALRGRIAQERTVNGTRMLEVVTDFGTVLVPAEQVQAVVPGTPPSTDTFVAEGVRVVRIQGQVERQAPGEKQWSPVRWTDAYGKEIVNAPNAIVRVGDRVRTFFGGEVDLQLHKDVWLRLAEDSELEIPAAPTSAATLTLARGRVLPQVEGRPRGATFKVATPSVLLGVRGTRFAVEVDDGGAAVLVAEGTVAVGDGPAVTAGQRVDLRRASAPAVRTLTPSEVAGLRVNVVRIPPESLVWIPGGRYTLGDGKDVTPDPWTRGGDYFGREACPAPDASNIDVLATVTLPGFLIDRRECSVEEFATFAAVRGLAMPEALRSHDPPPVPDRRPVWGVEWRMARSYACWVGRRLPSEAQWEVAARGRERRLWPWGNRLTSEQEALPAWRDCTGDERHRDAGVPRLYSFPKPCRSLRPIDAPTPDVSPFGVEALVSGVPEWTRDTWVGRGEGRYSTHVGEAELPSREKDSDVRKIARGAFLSARWAMDIRVYGGSAIENPGFRCVVELE